MQDVREQVERAGARGEHQLGVVAVVSKTVVGRAPDRGRVLNDEVRRERIEKDRGRSER